jgi:fatty acid desaturase
MTGAVFMVGHNARPMYAEEKAAGFYAQQVQTTQNVRVTALNCWFFGGLERQIEHHLFPDLPMLAYQRMQPKVRALCEKHGITYIQESVWKRIGKLVDVIVGNTQMKRVPHEAELTAKDTADRPIEYEVEAAAAISASA